MLSLLFFNLVEVPNIFSPIACALANKDGAPTEPNAGVTGTLTFLPSITTSLLRAPPAASISAFDNSLPAPKALYTLLNIQNGRPTPSSTAPANVASLFTSPITSLKL